MSQPATSHSAPKAPKSKRKLKLWLILGGVLAIVILAVVGSKVKNSGPKPEMVTTDKAAVRTIVQVVTASGKVQPEVEVRISSEVAGELMEIPLKEGAVVKRGDVLARIKDDYYQAQVDQGEASLSAARAANLLSKANRLKAESDFKKAEQLWQKNLISESDFITAQTNIEVAKADFDSSLAQIRRMEGSLNQSKDLINKTVVYAPMDGTISSLSCKVGERVLGTGQFAGTEIMRVADLKSMEARVKVNENDIVNVKLGDSAIISVDAFPDRKFHGKVYEISNSALSSGAAGSNAAAQAASASDEVTNFLVKIRIVDTVENLLRPGMSATVDIETRTAESVVSIPIQSVTVRAEGGKTTEELQADKKKAAQERSGNDLEVSAEKDSARRDREKLKRVVFVRSGDSVKLVPVETGIADNTYIEIKSGLKAGDEVVSGSYASISRRLKEGAKVKVEQAKIEEKK